MTMTFSAILFFTMIDLFLSQWSNRFGSALVLRVADLLHPVDDGGGRGGQ